MTIYQDENTGMEYYWDGDQYVQIDQTPPPPPPPQPKIKFVTGKYVDDKTFLDDDGNQVDFNDPDNTNYDMVIYVDNQTKKQYVWDKENQVLVELPPQPPQPKIKAVMGKYVDRVTFFDESGNPVDFHDPDNDNYDMVIYVDKQSTDRYVWSEKEQRLIKLPPPPPPPPPPRKRKKRKDPKKHEDPPIDPPIDPQQDEDDGENNWDDSDDGESELDDLEQIFNDKDALADFENDFKSIKSDPLLNSNSKTSWSYIGNSTSTTTISSTQELIKNLKKHLIAQAIEFGTIDEQTWKYLDVQKMSAGIMYKGTTQREILRVTKPTLYIYQDVSPSWEEDDLELAKQVLASLKQLNDQGIIQVELKYFATRVTDNPNNAGGDTRGEPVIDKINEVRPTNVMIVTDRDVWGIDRQAVKVPGCVWFIWKHGLVSKGFKNKLSGKKVFEFNMN